MSLVYSYACTFCICGPPASEEPPAHPLLSAQQPDPTRLSAAYGVLSDLASLATPPHCTPLCFTVSWALSRPWQMLDLGL